MQLQFLKTRTKTNQSKYFHVKNPKYRMNREPSRATFGTMKKEVEVEGFVLRQVSHAPHLSLARHDHGNANFNFTLKGSCKEIVGNKDLELLPLSIIFKPAGEHHANKYCDTGTESLLIEVLPAKLEKIRRHSDLFDNPSYTKGGTLSILAMKIYREFQTMNSSASELAIEGLILEILAEGTRQKTKDSMASDLPVWLRKARDFIHANFAEQIKLSDVAQVTGVNSTYLAKMFRRYNGCSVGEYVRQLQIEYSLRQLKETENSLAEIALSSGFYDQSHFTNAFKLYLKMTPAEFRSTNR